MLCIDCGFESPEAMLFCGRCGTPLRRLCAQCGCENPPDFTFCGQCATSLVPTTPHPSFARRGRAHAERIQRSAGRAFQRTRLKRREIALTKFLVKHPWPSGGPEPSWEAERRHLTVLFCDLAESTALSERLDPEELRDIVRKYQEACVAVVTSLRGFVARYVGDGILVYFGYPVAHEDDAQRAVRAGLGIIDTVRALPLSQQTVPQSLQVRVGIHSGIVVAGEMGGKDYPDSYAIIGETPNVAARIQGVAEKDTVVIGPTTHRLTEGFFECQDLGPHALKGLSTLMPLYRVHRESGVRNRIELAVQRGLTPLIGRVEELELLRDCWRQAQTGDGQAVFLNGEAGIGKSRLAQEFKAETVREGGISIEFHCSPYHQHSALHPIIEHLQQVLR